MSGSETSDTLEGMFRDAHGELAAAKREVERWQGVVKALDEAKFTVDAVATVFAPAKSLPIPRDAILQVMKEHPRVPMKLKQVLGYIHQANLYDPSLKAGDNSYGTALRRLSQGHYPISQADDGRYFYNPDFETAPDNGLPIFAGPHPRPSDDGA